MGWIQEKPMRAGGLLQLSANAISFGDVMQMHNKYYGEDGLLGQLEAG